MRKRLIGGILIVFLTIVVQGFSSQGDVGGEFLKPTLKNSPPVPSPSSIAPLLLSPVVRVVYGDTIVVQINGVQEKIRLIGVNTPETVDPRRPVECFGKEASTFTKSLLTDQQIRIESDPSQGDRDKYGRLLRYVFLADGTLVNEEIITEGYGYEYTYRTHYLYQTEFKKAQKGAQAQKKGLWAEGVCGK